ncbi:MAG: hypothetical protein ACLPKE_33755 [Streptosporangiaceae bacterium]
MDEHRDDLDTWLRARIDPLPPPPGTFERVRRRARRRRYRQVAVTAAAAAAVAAAVVVVPRVATSVWHVSQSPQANAAAANPHASGPASSGGTGSRGHAPRPAAPSAGSAAHSRPSTAPVPLDFAATSVTFVGSETGWVIGQAGTPGHCATPHCTSVARTDNAGASWYGVPAPMTSAPDGASGVSQIRFLNTRDGWAFGPELWATSDGGLHWSEVGTGGQRVIDLETVGQRAFAIFATCGGTGPDFAAQCTSFSLYSASAGQDSWAPVSPELTGLGHGGQDASAQLVLAGSAGYLLAPDGTLYSGPVSGSGSWQQAGSVPGSASCAPGTAQPDGQPSGALLAAATASTLALACAAPASAGRGAQVFTSPNGGASWQQAGTVSGGTVTSIAAQPGGEIGIATTSGIQWSSEGGASWQLAASSAGSGPPGGFRFIGMTSPAQGVAVPVDTAEHAVWFTFNGGQAWRSSPIAGS